MDPLLFLLPVLVGVIFGCLCYLFYVLATYRTRVPSITGSLWMDRKGRLWNRSIGGELVP